ncbi:pirin-like C-terminal cupin domain-containing protein [Bradyrhizobium elkanii]|uniref:pirin-like C-terminal cupin domain-containing protein n=1 Tax=Bradyrhizobium elkanii TaxID=29448 RepID=UPI003518B0C0
MRCEGEIWLRQCCTGAAYEHPRCPRAPNLHASRRLPYPRRRWLRGSSRGDLLEPPIVRHGPFVMNAIAELARAVRDYHAGRMEQI